jgi:DNA-binding transcriptional MerR regulator
MQSKTTFTISDVSQITGVASTTLRAWERRYGLVKPERKAKGHRVYTQDNITEIQQIVAWLDRGVAIRNIPALLKNDEEANTERDDLLEQDNQWQSTQHELFTAISSLHHRHADQLCDKLNKSMPFLTVCEQVYLPLLTALKARWQARVLGTELEQQLWAQLWQRQTTVMTLRSEKQKSIAQCWLVNLDLASMSPDYWFIYALLIQSGVRVNSINAAANLESLARLKERSDIPLVIFGSQQLNAAQHQQLISLHDLWESRLLCLGPMVNIDTYIFEASKLNHISGNASQSMKFKETSFWLKHIEKVS